jgi:ABC-type multidrug transport system ATPase subunit
VLIASQYPAQEGGIVDRVVLLRDGRVALYAPIEELDAQRLPLSLRGLTALADLAMIGD